MTQSMITSRLRRHRRTILTGPTPKIGRLRSPNCSRRPSVGRTWPKSPHAYALLDRSKRGRAWWPAANSPLPSWQRPASTRLRQQTLSKALAMERIATRLQRTSWCGARGRSTPKDQLVLADCSASTAVAHLREEGKAWVRFPGLHATVEPPGTLCVPYVGSGRRWWILTVPMATRIYRDLPRSLIFRFCPGFLPLRSRFLKGWCSAGEAATN